MAKFSPAEHVKGLFFPYLSPSMSFTLGFAGQNLTLFTK